MKKAQSSPDASVVCEEYCTYLELGELNYIVVDQFTSQLDTDSHFARTIFRRRTGNPFFPQKTAPKLPRSQVLHVARLSGLRLTRGAPARNAVWAPKGQKLLHRKKSHKYSPANSKWNPNKTFPKGDLSGFWASTLICSHGFVGAASATAPGSSAEPPQT